MTNLTSQELATIFGATEPIDIFSEPAGQCSDGGRDDPYWQTPEGVRLMAEMEETKARLAAERAETRLAEVAANARRIAEQEVLQAEAREQHRLRREAEAAEREVQLRIERAEMDARLEAMDAERAAKAQKRAVAIEARERQDPDFHAVGLCLYFTIEGAQYEGGAIDSEYDPADWELHEAEATNQGLIEKLKAEVVEAIAPWLSHFASLGAIRADDIEGSMLGEERAVTGEPCFYLVHRTDVADLEPARLGGFDEVVIELKTVPGSTLVLSSYTCPVNATLLYEATREGVAVGWCGGKETPDLTPAGGEERGDWLERVCVGGELLARRVERWVDSGRNPSLYRMYGDFTEREAGDVDVEFVVPNRLPRGDLTLFVGDSGIGKSTIVHSWVAALGARGGVNRPRTVLGQDIHGRFNAAIISGEDSPGVISDRAKRHAKIWDRCTYYGLNRAIDGSLQDCLDKLMQVPVLDLVVIDTIRSFMEGSEQTSDGMNEFLTPISIFARRKNCAVVLVHHIKKSDGPCRSLGRVKELIRGSNALVAAVRMTIGAFQNREGLTEIGPIAFNFPEDMVWLPPLRSERYEFDPDTATLLRASESNGVARASPRMIQDPAAVEERVWSAVACLNSAGSDVRRSGRSGLYEARLPELAGVARAAILKAIVALTESGRMSESSGGLRAISEASV